MEHKRQVDRKHRKKDRQYISKKKRAERKSRKPTNDPNHMTIAQKKAHKKKIKAIEKRKRATVSQVTKRKVSAKEFAPLKCHKCLKEKFKKEFSARQFKYETPTCRKCTKQMEADQKKLSESTTSTK